MLQRNSTASRWLLRCLLAAALSCAVSAPGFAQPGRGGRGGRGGPPDAGRRDRFALRELDRFLDHHPLIEDDLRRDPQRVQSERYLSNNPELGQFLATNPEIPPAVATQRRYYLHRALSLQAAVPLRHMEIVQFDSYLDHDAAVERALNDNPALIHDERFLRAHPSLRDFLAGHPVLGRAFLSAPAVVTPAPAPSPPPAATPPAAH